MHTLQISLYAIAISFCLFFALLSRRLLVRLSLSYFIIYLILKAFSFSFAWLEFHPSAPAKGLWFTGFMCSAFLFSPCLWLLSLEVSTNSPPSPAPTRHSRRHPFLHLHLEAHISVEVTTPGIFHTRTRVISTRSSSIETTSSCEPSKRSSK